MSGSADGRCFRLPVSGTRGRVSTLSFKSSYVAFLCLIGKHAIAPSRPHFFVRLGYLRNQQLHPIHKTGVLYRTTYSFSPHGDR